LLAAVLLVVATILPLLSPAGPRAVRYAMQGGVMLCALARIPVSIDLPPLRMLASILVLAGAWLYITGLLRTRAWMLPASLSIALFVDQTLRALGHTYDPSLRLAWLPAQALLSAAVIYLSFGPTRARGASGVDERAGFAAGLSFGAAFFLLASLLAMPGAAARWTGGRYAITVAWMLALTTLPLWPMTSRIASAGRAWQRTALALLVPLGLALAYQGRPVVSSAALAVSVAALWLLLPYSLTTGQRAPQIGAAAGFVALMVLGTAHVLAFTYAYTLAAFEGLGLPTLMLAAIVAVTPALLPDAGKGLPAVPFPTERSPRWAIVALATWLLAVVWALPHPLQLQSAGDTIRLGTYNIHYGYDSHWRLSLEAQSRTIAQSGAQVVALQEVDAGRLTSYGVDHALWLARRLGMQVVYLPTVERNTGIALLSRVPVLETAGTALPSHAEPTGILRASVQVGGLPLHVHGTWLGLTPEERDRQLAAALGFMASNQRATLAGDLNATPESSVYHTLEAAGFIDPFIAGGSSPAPTHPSLLPEMRIDYVWLRGIEPVNAFTMNSTASDHLMVVVEAR
jgi:endonuclease/exonuclease/phosphatase family metal-dependent hydrolase